MLKLIIEPADGVAPLLALIKSAKRSVEIAVFRFDRKDIETALKAAAERGVKVTALIAFANRGGEQGLRRLELRCLAAGIIVARTSDDLIRYHGKYILIDRRVLCVLSFNFTRLDIDRSRGFGIVTTNPQWVREATRLFRADCTRSKYTTKTDTFVVSPTNSRQALDAFVKGAKKELLIYDPKISDKEMLRTLQARAKAGVEIKVIGSVAKRGQIRRTQAGPTAAHAHDHPRPASGLHRQPEPAHPGTGFTPRGRPDRPGCEGGTHPDRDFRIRLGGRERQEGVRVSQGGGVAGRAAR